MATLISYKKKDENRYSTFSNVSFAANDDNLAFKAMPASKKSTKPISPAVHKRGKRPPNKKPQKGWRRVLWTCCYDRKRTIRSLWCPWLCCFGICCKRKNRKQNNDDDIDAAVEEYKQKQGLSGSGPGSQKSTLKSENDASRFWGWDDSWKSNSDKFLESLELDCVDSDKSLKRKLRQKNSKVRVTTFNKFVGG